MNARDRNKAALLESIMARHDAAERRTLADLHRAGFRFRSIESARHRLKVQRSLHGFTQRQIDIAVAALDRSGR